MHLSDNYDGTFTNPVMSNVHWSDPTAIRVGDDYCCITSSAETCPIMQILHSNDMVNWNVNGSASRSRYPHLPAGHNWSPSGYFTTFHPGLFAGETIETKTDCWADFDNFHFIDFE